jgi:hypothetical protein
VQPHRALIRHCPRCVARNRVIVELFSSTLAADVLYDENSLPRVDGESLRSRRTATTASTPPAGKQHQRAQVAEKLRGVERLGPVAESPIAISPSAVDE